MAASDILVHCPSQPEPFGRVVAEGMLAAKPVIASSSGGILEIIENYVTGILIPPKDSLSIAAAIKFLLENPAEAKIIGERGRKEVRRRFSVIKHINNVKAVYSKALHM
jgi:glycosyltransferase involved in cell wall biosynthesis